jgi:hypothetical protein
MITHVGALQMHQAKSIAGQPLVPVAKMPKKLIAKLAVQAEREKVRVLLKNGLKLNYNGKGSIEVDLEKALAYNEQFERIYPPLKTESSADV